MSPVPGLPRHDEQTMRRHARAEIDAWLCYAEEEVPHLVAWLTRLVYLLTFGFLFSVSATIGSLISERWSTAAQMALFAVLCVVVGLPLDSVRGRWRAHLARLDRVAARDDRAHGPDLRARTATARHARLTASSAPLTSGGSMRLGQFGRAYRESLQENAPAMWRQLQATGQLDAHLREKDEEGGVMYQHTIAMLRRNEPEPEGYLASVQHLQGLLSRAREIVLDDLLIPTPREDTSA